MKATDIIGGGPRGPEYAVKVPRYAYGKRDGSDIVKAQVERVVGHYVLLWAHPTNGHPVVKVPLANVLGTWADYQFGLAWDEAHRMDSNRTMELAYQAERARRMAKIEAALPGFAGIETPPFGSSTIARPDVPITGELRDILVESQSRSACIPWEGIVAIGNRLLQLEQQVAELSVEKASGWVA